MRKRKIPLNTPRLDLMPEPVDPLSWNTSIILRLMTRDFYSLYPDEREMLMALVLLIKNKLDPDDYEILFRLLSNHSLILSIPDHLSGVDLPAPASKDAPVSSLDDTASANPDGSPVKPTKKRRSKKKAVAEQQPAEPQQLEAIEQQPAEPQQLEAPEQQQLEAIEPQQLEAPEQQTIAAESVLPYDYPLPFSFD